MARAPRRRGRPRRGCALAGAGRAVARRDAGGGHAGPAGVASQPLQQVRVGAARRQRLLELALDAQRRLVAHAEFVGEGPRSHAGISVHQLPGGGEPGGDTESGALHEGPRRRVDLRAAVVARVGAPLGDPVEAAHDAAMPADRADAVRGVHRGPQPVQAGGLVADRRELRDTERAAAESVGSSGAALAVHPPPLVAGTYLAHGTQMTSHCEGISSCLPACHSDLRVAESDFTVSYPPREGACSLPRPVLAEEVQVGGAIARRGRCTLGAS